MADNFEASKFFTIKSLWNVCRNSWMRWRQNIVKCRMGFQKCPRKIWWQCYETFFLHRWRTEKLASALVPKKLIQSSFIFTTEAGARWPPPLYGRQWLYLQFLDLTGKSEFPLFGSLLALPANNRPDWKGLPGTSTRFFCPFVSYKCKMYLHKNLGYYITWRY